MRKAILLSVVATIGMVNATFDFITDLTAAATFVSTNCGSDWKIWSGLVMGIQQDTTSTSNDCITSFNDFTGNIDALPDYITSLGTSGGGYDNSAITAFTTNPYYQPGTYFKLAKRGTELAALFYAFQDKCYIKDLVIAWGKTLNSISGALNTATVSVVQILNLLDGDSSSNRLVTMTDAITSYNNGAVTASAACESVGTAMGQLVTDLFNIQVPETTKSY